MKKLLLVIFAIFVLLGCASSPVEEESVSRTIETLEDFPRGLLNAKLGEEVSLFFQGGYLIHGSQELIFRDLDISVPPYFHDDNVSFMYETTYFFEGEERVGRYEVIYSGVKVYDHIIVSSRLSPAIEPGTPIGTATADEPFVVIRSSNLDPHLVATSEMLPTRYNGFWYFTPESLTPTSMKWLYFEPIESKDEKFTLMPYMGLTLKELAEDTEGKTEIYTIPSQQIMIEAVLDEYPQEFNYESLDKIRPLSKGLIMNTFRNCTTETTVTFDDINLQLFFQTGFDEYLLDEYTLGEPLYLFINLKFSANGELLCYVRDFGFEIGEEIVKRKTDYILENW